MRVIKYLFLSFVCAFSLSAVSQTWTIVGNVPNPGQYPSICVASNNVAWIAGGSGDTSKLFRTTNGGVNWIQINTSNIQRRLTAVWGFNADMSFVGEGDVTGNAKLYKTTNGGLNWTVALQTPGNGGYITGLAFTKALNNVFGYAMATRIYRTSNMGNTWIEINSGSNGVSNALYSLMIIDNNFYGFGLDNGAARVKLTTDNGTVWGTHAVNIVGNYTSGIAFHTYKQMGLVSTSSSMPIVSRTTNSGLTWDIVDVGPGLSGTTYINWIPFCTVVYILGENGKVKRSINSGVNWSNMQTANVNNVKHFDFVNYGGVIYGYAVSSLGPVLRLADSILIITGDIKKNQIPDKFELMQNYPNPFNPTTSIDYSLPSAGMVTLTVFNAMGKEVKTLVNERKEAGSYSEMFNATDLASGVYYYKISSGSFSETKKMILIK